MFILPLIALLLLILISVKSTTNFCYSILRGAVVFGALTVLACELLSLFSLYSFWPLTIYWLAVIAITLFLFKKTFYEKISICWTNRPKSLKWQEWISLAVLVFLAGATFVDILLYPPVMNFDANVYHMPRVFFWLKNASVHNYPTSVNIQIAMGPLPSFFVAQFQALLGGNDALAAFVQWFAYVGNMVCAAGISKQFGATRKSQFYAAVLVSTVPMALLQAVTTQADLFLSFCVLTVIYFSVYCIKNLSTGKQLIDNAVIFGLSLGLAVLAKLSSIAILLPFALLFIIVYLKKKQLKQLAIYAALIVSCTFIICSGFFIRNALDFEGDFLALKHTGYQPSAATTLGDRIVSTTMNFSRNFAFDNSFVYNAINNGVLKLVDLLDVEIDASIARGIQLKNCGMAFETFLVPPNEHNISTNPYHAYLFAGSALVALLSHAFGKKKKDHFLIAYVGASILSYIMVCAMITYVSSISRYLLPSLLAGLAIIPVIFQEGRIKQALFKVIMLFAVLLHILLAVFASTQPLLLNDNLATRLRMYMTRENYSNTSREDLRKGMIKALYPDTWDAQAYNRMITEMLKHKEIGINNISAEYDILYYLRDDYYDVRHFQPEFHATKQSQTFEPEVVIIGNRTPAALNVLENIEEKYELFETCGGLKMFIAK